MTSATTLVAVGCEPAPFPYNKISPKASPVTEMALFS